MVDKKANLIDNSLIKSSNNIDNKNLATDQNLFSQPSKDDENLTARFEELKTEKEKSIIIQIES